MPDKNILIVDDDRLIIKILVPYLESKGFKVSSACDGEEGIEAIKSVVPDLLILDVQMPKMNGYSFLFELKKIPGADKLPVIILTSKDGMAEIFKYEGVKEYINKPVNNDALLQLIQKYI